MESHGHHRTRVHGAFLLPRAPHAAASAAGVGTGGEQLVRRCVGRAVGGGNPPAGGASESHTRGNCRAALPKDQRQIQFEGSAIHQRQFRLHISERDQILDLL